MSKELDAENEGGGDLRGLQTPVECAAAGVASGEKASLGRGHEEPQGVIFLHGIWRHIKEFGIEGQIPRISSPVKLEKRC